MTSEQREKLMQKMKAEQDSYREWLLSRPPPEILYHANEYSVREDVLYVMENIELLDFQAKALLRSPCPLADVIHAYNLRESSRNDEIENCIVAEANRRIPRQKQQEER